MIANFQLHPLSEVFDKLAQLLALYQLDSLLPEEGEERDWLEILWASTTGKPVHLDDHRVEKLLEGIRQAIDELEDQSYAMMLAAIMDILER